MTVPTGQGTADASASGIAVAEHAAALRIVHSRALRGPNRWRLAPVVLAELRVGPLASVTPADVPDLQARLLAALPDLNEASGRGERLSRDADLPRSWGGALLRLALELQRLAGGPVDFARVVDDAPEADRWTVLLGCDEEVLATEALYGAARVLRDCLRGHDPEIDDLVAGLTRLYHRARPDATSLAMLEAARRRGIPVRRNRDDGIVQFGLGAAQRRLRATTTERTSVLATAIASDRQWTKTVLGRVGLPVPAGGTARTLEGALEIATDLGFPLRLAPINASNGRGISARLDSLDAVREAWPRTIAEHEVAVIERFVEGSDHRVVVVNGRVVACVERVPASGEVRRLRATADISTGGSVVDRTDEMHPRNRMLCELAAGAVGLDVAGLDVRTADISVPFDENGAVVIGVHASPELRMHTHPDRGVSRDVPGAILDMLYPPGAPATIPVIAVTGTNGKTTTTRLIAHLFRESGERVGFTTTDGVYFQEHLVLEGDLTGPFAASIILSHREVEVAVLETARGGIVREGLGFDACDVAVVLNVSIDHLGVDGIDTVEQLAEVKAVIPSVVKPTGHAILNADDPLVLAMRERTRGTVVLLTSGAATENVHVVEQLARGGMAASVERAADGEWLALHDGARRMLLARVREVPLTFGGAARFQLQNLLAASAAAHVQGMPIERIRDGLCSFAPSAARTPGRLNFVETTRGRVIIDYAHNAAALAGLFDFVTAMPASRHLVLLSVPGDRRDEDLREIGGLAARMDYVVFKEHERYRRGRAPGESARLLAAGLLATGFPPERLAMFDEEADGVAHVVALMRPGDLVVMIADGSEAMTQLRPHLAGPDGEPTGPDGAQYP